MTDKLRSPLFASRVMVARHVEVRADELPVFWACGMTPQSMIAAVKPEFCIKHHPSIMLVTDRKTSGWEEITSKLTNGLHPFAAMVCSSLRITFAEYASRSSGSPCAVSTDCATLTNSFTSAR
jgi:hypothetical protein